MLAAFDEDGDGQISPEEFANALKQESLLGSAGVAVNAAAAAPDAEPAQTPATGEAPEETLPTGPSKARPKAGAASYEDIISGLGSNDGGTDTFGKLDGALMKRDSDLLAARIAKMDKGLLKPGGQLMTYWDFFTLSALFFTATITPYEVCLMWESPAWSDGVAAWLTPLFVVNICVNLIFMVDIVFNFFLPYKESVRMGGGLVKSHKRIVRHYLRGWFCLDVVSVLPVDLLLMAIDTTKLSGATMLSAIRMLRLLRLIKLARILRASRIFSRWENKISLSYGNRQLIMLAVSVLLLLHWFSCLLGLLAQLMAAPRTPELRAAIEATVLVDGSCTGCTTDLLDARNSVCYGICLTPCESYTLAEMEVGEAAPPGALDAQLALVLAKETWPCRYAAAGKIASMPSYHGELWIAGLYVAMIQLGGGVGSIVPENLPEYILFFLCILFGSVAWAGVVGTICAVLTTSDPATIEFRQNMDSLNYFLADMNLSSSMRIRAREYLRNKRDLYKKASYNELLSSILSPQLRIEVVGKISGDMLTATVWYLREVERACLVELALQIERAVYAPREKVPPLGLNILMRGVCAKAGTILTPISTWGEDVVVSAVVLRDTRAVSALTYVEVAYLTREAFDRALAAFPESARVIKNAAIKIAMQRAIVVVSEASKALEARKNNPQAGHTPLTSLLQSGSTSQGAQLDIESVIPLLMGKSVKSLEELDGEAGHGGEEGALGAQLAAVHARLDAQRAEQGALGSKVDDLAGKVEALGGTLGEVLALLKTQAHAPRSPRLESLP